MIGASVNARRGQPRLWVETLWLVESLESGKPLREIPLRRGLNLILSEPMDGSSGHGVGKTAFCQLLRFVLEDPQWAAGTPLRDELRVAMPDGAVAARVHVDGETWTVLKPWRHQKQYRAARQATWQQLARNEVANEHEVYARALDDKLVGALPVHRLPGSHQTIQWQHILAWCSRDQGSRYQSYYHWRTEGTGFKLPAQSPALVVKVLLGLLRDTSAHDKLKGKESDLVEVQASIAQLARRPTDLLAHVKHQLASALGVEESSPFRKASLFDETSLHGLAEQQIERCSTEIQEQEKEQKTKEQEKTDTIEQRAPLLAARKLIANRIAQLKAAIEGNAAEVDRLKREPEALQNKLSMFCELGDRLMSDCSYVLERAGAVRIGSARDAAERKLSNEEYGAELLKQERRLLELDERLSPLNQRIFSLSVVIEEGKRQEVTILGRKKKLEDAISQYHFYEGIISNLSQWQEMLNLQDTEKALENEIGQLKLSIKNERSQYVERREAISSLTEAIAKQLPGFTWGIFDDSRAHPFHMGPMHSTTYGVLETLAGDLTCLLDSSRPESHHPGFLLHDSPREAEMSESLFWSLLSVAVSADVAPYQYVVTTSTKVPSDYKDFVRLELHSKTDEGLLLWRRIGAVDKPLDL